MNKASQSWRDLFFPRTTSLDQSFCHFASARLAASSVLSLSKYPRPEELSTQPRWRSVCWWEDSNCRYFFFASWACEQRKVLMCHRPFGQSWLFSGEVGLIMAYWLDNMWRITSRAVKKRQWKLCIHPVCLNILFYYYIPSPVRLKYWPAFRKDVKMPSVQRPHRCDGQAQTHLYYFVDPTSSLKHNNLLFTCFIIRS